jgi:hypothetical protein
MIPTDLFQKKSYDVVERIENIASDMRLRRIKFELITYNAA